MIPTDKQIREMDRFVRFIKRLKEENLLGVVGIINVNPKTNEIDILRLKDGEKE